MHCAPNPTASDAPIATYVNGPLPFGGAWHIDAPDETVVLPGLLQDAHKSAARITDAAMVCNRMLDVAAKINFLLQHIAECRNIANLHIAITF